MTVCIAAINKKEKAIAFAADRMVTATFPPIEFEHTIPKMTKINEYCVALTAGDAIKSREIFDKYKEVIGEKKLTVNQITQSIKDIYQGKRLQILEDLCLKSRGINHKFFIEAGGKLLPIQVYLQIDHILATYNLGVEAIIAGIDGNGPGLFGIRNPGIDDCYNAIGFHAIGIGAMHAMISLTDTYEPETTAQETLYSVFRAKRVAEIAPGVGQETDLWLLITGKDLKHFNKNDELIIKFNELYKNEKEERRGLIKRTKVDTIQL